MNYRKFLDAFPHRHIDSGGRLDAWTVWKLGNYCLEVGEFGGCMTYGPHDHPASTERLFFAVGTGYISVGRRRVPYMPGTVISIPKGVSHKLEAKDMTILLSLQNPPIFNQGKDSMHHE
jgi:mannose-6-phosphate isomerase-like protein (cupin superfamily)